MLVIADRTHFFPNCVNGFVKNVYGILNKWLKVGSVVSVEPRIAKGVTLWYIMHSFVQNVLEVNMQLDRIKLYRLELCYR